MYTYPENYRAYKAQIAAQYSGANVKVAQGFVFGETNKTAAFLKKFPLGKVRFWTLTFRPDTGTVLELSTCGVKGHTHGIP